MTDKPLVERLREGAVLAITHPHFKRYVDDSLEAAALIEQLTQGNDGETPKSVDDVRSRHAAFEHWHKQGGGYRSQEVADVGFLLAAIADLTASRDRHEKDVDVFRQRWIEKCAEVAAAEDRFQAARDAWDVLAKWPDDAGRPEAHQKLLDAISGVRFVKPSAEDLKRAAEDLAGMEEKR